MDQNHDRGGDRDGRCCVQNDAERAVVGIGVNLVHVGDLDEREQGQQEQAKHAQHHAFA